MARAQVTIYIVIATVILLVFGYVNSIPSPIITPTNPDTSLADQTFIEACIGDMASQAVLEFVTSGDIHPDQSTRSSWGNLAVFSTPDMVPSTDSASAKIALALDDLVGGCAYDAQGFAPDYTHTEALITEESIQFTITMPIQIQTPTGVTTRSDYHYEFYYPIPTHIRIARQAVSAFDPNGYINISKLSNIDAEFNIAQGSDGTHFVTQTDPQTETTYTYAVRPQ